MKNDYNFCELPKKLENLVSITTVTSTLMGISPENQISHPLGRTASYPKLISYSKYITPGFYFYH